MSSKEEGEENTATFAWEQHSSGRGRKWMEKMGYEAGKGLGKFKQGRTVPIDLPSQRHKRGLGFDFSTQTKDAVMLLRIPELDGPLSREERHLIYRVMAAQRELMQSIDAGEPISDIEISHMMNLVFLGLLVQGHYCNSKQRVLL